MCSERSRQWGHGNQVLKFTDGKTVAGKASQDLWKMEFKNMETTLGDMEVDVAMEVARELGSTERMDSQVIGSGVDLGKGNQRMKNHANYFENPGKVD